MAYDHPGYLTRQFEGPFTTTAGANGTSTWGVVYPYDIHIHTVSAVVKTAGTSAASGNQVFLLAGTSTVVGTPVALGTNTAGFVGTSADAAATVAAGTVIHVKNGTDATGVAIVNFEFNVAPNAAQNWVGNV